MGGGETLNDERLQHVQRFYSALSTLELRCGGWQRLASCSGTFAWPRRGVYFFTEDGEVRRESGNGPRIVRFGTHALKGGAQTTLWKRLAQHRGSVRSGAGSHRSSIFRSIVGTSLMARDRQDCPTWGERRSSTLAKMRAGEVGLERAVSEVIGAMPFLWLAVDDDAGATSMRAYIERNSIALLSNFGKEAIDAPSPTWLGHHCDRVHVRTSGLWNINHVDERYDSRFLDALEEHVAAQGAS